MVDSLLLTCLAATQIIKGDDLSSQKQEIVYFQIFKWHKKEFKEPSFLLEESSTVSIRNDGRWLDQQTLLEEVGIFLFLPVRRMNPFFWPDPN